MLPKMFQGNIVRFIMLIISLERLKCNTHTKDLKEKDQIAVQIIEGGNIDILCDSAGYQDQQIYWESDDKSFHIDGNQLFIKDITRNRSGSYGCYSRNSDRSDVLQIVSVDVLHPTKIISWDSPYSRLRQNDSYDMVVYIQGNPPPNHILLLSNQTGDVLFRDEGNGKRNITIKSVQCGDSRIYRLYAVNDLNSDVITKNITVFCVPYVDPEITTQFETRPLLGETISLEMHAAGYPQPNFTWSFGGVPCAHTDEGYTSKVKLENIGVDDFGTYQLDMENSVGKATYIFHVIPSGPPEPPSNLTFIESSQYSATISWKPGYDYNSTQTFVIQDSKFNVLYEITEGTNDYGNITIQTIDHLTPNHLYNVTIYARNINGTSRDPRGVSFYTQESAVSPWIIIAAVSSLAILFLFSLAIKYSSKLNLKKSEKENKDDCEETKHLLAENQMNSQDYHNIDDERQHLFDDCQSNMLHQKTTWYKSNSQHEANERYMEGDQVPGSKGSIDKNGISTKVC